MKGGSTFRGQDKWKQSLPGKNEKQWPWVHCYLLPVPTTLHVNLSYTDLTLALPTMCLLKVFQWLPVTLRIVPNLNGLHIPTSLVLSCLWSTTFFRPPHFSPCGLHSSLGQLGSFPPQGLDCAWEHFLSSFCLVTLYTSYTIQWSLLRTTLYFSTLWPFILYNTFWPVILLWLDGSNPPTKSSLSTLCFPFPDLIKVAAVHLSVKLFDSYWL